MLIDSFLTPDLSGRRWVGWQNNLENISKMTSKISQILVLAVTLSATPTSQAREAIEASNRQMQVRNDYDQFNNWGSWTRPPTTKVYTTVQYPPTTKVYTTVPYTPTALPSVWSTQSVPRISRKRASSILTPTEYCDMDFQEMTKISSQDSICNMQVSGYFYKKCDTQSWITVLFV